MLNCALGSDTVGLGQRDRLLIVNVFAITLSPGDVIPFRTAL
jgi:hypothetical protein